MIEAGIPMAELQQMEEAPVAECNREDSAHPADKIPTSQGTVFFVNCFLMPWIPDSLATPENTPSTEASP